MYSLGDLIDKLVIENIKIFRIREELKSKELDDQEYVELNSKMMTLNDNRRLLGTLLDQKLDRVIDGSEQNCLFKHVKTYREDSSNETQ